MGRPRKTGNLFIFRIKLRLWEGEDDDLIAFLQAIPEGKRDRRLDQKLEAEAAGIFNWALKGLERLQTKGYFTRAKHVQNKALCAIHRDRILLLWHQVSVHSL